MPAQETDLLTVADWRAAFRQAGPWAQEPQSAPWAQFLQQRRARFAAGLPNAVWIAFVNEARLANRIDELATLAIGLTTDQVLSRWPLFGVPFAVKDNIDVEGWPTTAACPAWEHTAPRHATVVRKLLAAGAVLFGKTNLDQFATGLVGTRSPYGAPASALVPGHVSGGSSSGSAVAVAQGAVAFALGTDTAGSGRVPAAFNNIVGLKPTPGRVSTHGVLPACRTLDCVSIFALTVSDAAAVLAVVEGEDADDDYSAFTPGPARWRWPESPVRIGVPLTPVLDAAQRYDIAWTQAVQRLHELGCEAVPIDFEPLHSVARLLYEGPWVAERYLAMQPLLRTQPQAIDPTVAGIVSGATRFTAMDTFAAQYLLQRARAQAERLWQQVDLLMVPSVPRHPSFEDVAADPVGANAALGTYTNFVNLLGWSALALPAGRTPAGWPFGATFIAPAHHDAALAHWGRAWQGGSADATLGATARRFGETLAATVGGNDQAAGGGSASPVATAPTMPAAPSIAAQWPRSEPVLPLAVVGAHLSGLPLNGQLLERGATLAQATRTAPHYRLYELPHSQPPKPGLLRVAEGGAAIELEVWHMPQHAVGSFLALIPPPLGLGSIELADGRHVHGFLCEAAALAQARDITAHGGWRAWMTSRPT